MATRSREPTVGGSRKPSRYALVLYHLTGESVLLTDATWASLPDLQRARATRPAIWLFDTPRAADAVRSSFHGWAAFVRVVPI